MAISSITSGPRQSNMELLRIVAMILVVIVHSDFTSLGTPTYDDIHTDPANGLARLVIEAFALVAVNTFVLISGWFGIRPSARGLCGFIFQWLFLSLGAYGVMVATGDAPLNADSASEAIWAYWFVPAYVGMYVMAPVMNSFLREASRRQIATVVVGFYVVQTAVMRTTHADMFLEGYDPLSFMGLYLLAGFIRRFYDELPVRRWRAGAWAGVYALCVVANAALYFWPGWKMFLHYSNPLTVAGAMALTLSFARMRIAHSAIINTMARGAFGVYLLHMNPWVYRGYFKPLMRQLYDSMDGPLTIVIMGVAVVLIFEAGVVLDLPRRLIWERIAPLIPKKQTSPATSREKQ